MSVDFERSASSTTTSGFWPSSMRASAHPCLVSLSSRFVVGSVMIFSFWFR